MRNLGEDSPVIGGVDEIGAEDEEETKE